MKDPWLTGLKEDEGIQFMPDLPCHYIFRSLPQEWKVRHSLDQDSPVINDSLPNKSPDNKSNPQCIWYSSISLSLDMTDTLLGTEPKLNSLVYRELWRLQTKQRWGNASYPHPQIHSELQSLYQKWEGWTLAEAAKPDAGSAHPSQEESKKGTN